MPNNGRATRRDREQAAYRRGLSTAVTVEDGIRGQEVDQIVEAALAAGGKETAGKFVTLFGGWFESRLSCSMRRFSRVNI